MSKKLRTEAVDHLFDAILSLENREECYTFFEDVCTVNELLSLSQRFEVAKMLRDQKTYLDIAEKTSTHHLTILKRSRKSLKWFLKIPNHSSIESNLPKLRDFIHRMQVGILTELKLPAGRTKLY